MAKVRKIKMSENFCLSLSAIAQGKLGRDHGALGAAIDIGNDHPSFVLAFDNSARRRFEDFKGRSPGPMEKVRATSIDALQDACMRRDDQDRQRSAP
jgi:hypothetical protein